MRRLVRRLRDDRGDGDVAAMIVIVPIIFGVVLLFVYVGRQGVAAEGVTHAAAVAARAASMERSAGEANAAASAAASATLAAAGTSCSGGPAVAVSVSSWEPGGVVTVTVTCQVQGISEIGAPARSVSGTARSVLDSHRGLDD